MLLKERNAIYSRTLTLIVERISRNCCANESLSVISQRKRQSLPTIRDSCNVDVSYIWLPIRISVLVTMAAQRISVARAFDISCERLSNRLERYVHCSTSWVTGVPSCGIFDDNNNNNNSNRISNDEESSTNKVDSPTLIDESFVNCEKTIINKNNSGFYLFNFFKEI